MDLYNLISSSWLKASFLAVAMLCVFSGQAQRASLKPRVIILTDIAPNDIEPDDMESTIRLLAHADLFEIEGLVATTGWSNTGGLEHPELIHDAINAYEKDSPNLLKRSAQKNYMANEGQQSIGYWPSPSYLRTRTVTGSKKMGIQFVGEENKSAGSDLIIKMADEKDSRPVWILVWGGGNTLAQAIWQVQKTRTPAELKTFLHKLRVYTITDQDRPYASYAEGGRKSRYDFSSHYWMRKEFSKDLLFIWDESAWFYQNDTGKKNWEQYAEHIQGHGNLGKLYPKYKWGVEGDTPSFLYVLPNGLSDAEHPETTGWGGTFHFSISRDSVTSAYTNYREIPVNAVSRKYEEHFYAAIFNNFAARMDWAKEGIGNRNPVVVVNGRKDFDPIQLNPKEGSTVTLDATTSYDPDGDGLAFSWWVMEEAGSYKEHLPLSGNDSKRVTIKIPPGSAGKTIHIICEVTDKGTHPLTSYKRIILRPAK